MSTNRSVGHSAAAQENGRSAAKQENDGSAVATKFDRSAVKPKKDRSNLCAFTFADGRQCRTPRRSGHPHLCYFHAQKEAKARAAKQAGEAIRFPLKLASRNPCRINTCKSGSKQKT